MHRGARSTPNIICIDCTETFFSGLNTGIQRVVTQIVSRSSLLSERIGVPCIPVVGLGGTYYRLKDLQLSQKKISEKIGKIKHWIRESYYQYRSIFVSKKTFTKTSTGGDQDPSVLPYRTSEKVNFLIRFENKIRNSVGKLFALIPQIVFRTVIKNSPSVLFGRECLLLVPDGFFGRYYDLAALKNAFYAEASIIPLIYDLFPITHPELCHEENVRIYPHIFEKVLPISAGFMTISKSGMNDLKDYISSRHPQFSHLPVRFFHLGADFWTVNECSAILDTLRKLPASLEKRSFYLVVGTIEPRKDHLTVLSAFEQLWAEGFDASLVFVGRIGWKCEEVLQKIKNSAYNNDRLHFLGSVDDETLFSLYLKAEALIFSSIAEGFGLPLVEAMNMGIPVIVSNINVFREIGGEYPFYFDVRSSTDLARAVHEVSRLKSSSELFPVQSKKWYSWDDAAVSYIQNALDIYSQARSIDRNGIFSEKHEKTSC